MKILFQNNRYYFLSGTFFVLYALWVYILKCRGILSNKEQLEIITTLAGWIIVLLVAIMQLQKTREDNQKAKKEEFRKSLEIDAYREISRSATSLSKTLISSNNFSSVQMSLTLYIQYGLNFDKPRHCIEIDESVIALYQTEAEFLRTIGANEITILDYAHYRRFINLRIHEVADLLLKFSQYLNNTSLEQLKTSDGKTRFENICKSGNEKIVDVQCYLHDYRIFLMNHMLGDIFGVSVPYRKPKYPKYKTLSEVATKEMVDKEYEDYERRGFKWD